MENVPDTALGKMYRAHIGYILEGNLEALLDQYTDDCLLISSFTHEPQYYRGHQELTKHFEGLLGSVVDIDDTIAFWAETDDPQTLMMVEAVTFHMKDGTSSSMRFGDSWVLRDGRIAIHFAGMTQYPDGSVA